MSDQLLWLVIRIPEECNKDNIRVINIFRNRKVVIGELVKRFIKDKINNTTKSKLEKEAYDFRRRLLEGDTNDYESSDGYTYVISSCIEGKYSYFVKDVVSMYNSIKGLQ